MTIANAGDLAKEAGLIPGAATTPELPSTALRPIGPACPTAPIRGFGLVWSEHPEVYALLGCPGFPEGEQGADVAIQRFERGWLLRLVTANPPGLRGPAPAPQIYVLFADNMTFASFLDTWSAPGDPVSTGLTPPAGRLEPVRGFGKVWREQAALRARLGPPTAPERAIGGAVEEFDNGQLLWTEERLIFALFADGSWVSVPDRFVD